MHLNCFALQHRLAIRAYNKPVTKVITSLNALSRKQVHLVIAKLFLQFLNFEIRLNYQQLLNCHAIICSATRFSVKNNQNLVIHSIALSDRQRSIVSFSSTRICVHIAFDLSQNLLTDFINNKIVQTNIFSFE